MKMVVLVSATVAIVAVAALGGLVAFSRPGAAEVATDGGVDFGFAMTASYNDLPDPLTYVTRNGTKLAYRRYDHAQDGARRLIVLVHGSAWHGMQFHPMAKALSAKGLGTVIVPDLRGHGAAPERRGDVDYIGQLEDDLADLIAGLEGAANFEEVILAGHSSGGGLVVRFAGSAHGAMADRYVLMAPFLKHDAPTTRPNVGGWASPAIGRIIGLTILNQIGIAAFNHLPVISFAMAAQVLDGPYGDTATTRYSYRLNTSFAPRSDYERDLRAMTQPFLLIAGADDETFFADRYEAVISAQTRSGTYRVLPGIGHIGVTIQQPAIDAVAEWIASKSPDAS